MPFHSGDHFDNIYIVGPLDPDECPDHELTVGQVQQLREGWPVAWGPPLCVRCKNPFFGIDFGEGEYDSED